MAEERPKKKKLGGAMPGAGRPKGSGALARLREKHAEAVQREAVQNNIRKLCQNAAGRAVMVALDIMDCKKAPNKERMEAARMVLEWAFISPKDYRPEQSGEYRNTRFVVNVVGVKPGEIDENGDYSP